MQVKWGGELTGVTDLIFPVVEGCHTSVRRMWANASLLDWILASSLSLNEKPTDASEDMTVTFIFLQRMVFTACSAY